MDMFVHIVVQWSGKRRTCRVNVTESGEAVVRSRFVDFLQCVTNTRSVKLSWTDRNDIAGVN